MTDRSARQPASPLVVALRLALEEIAARRELERAGRRATMQVVQGGKRSAA